MTDLTPDNWLWTQEEFEAEMGPAPVPDPARIESLDVAERHTAAAASLARAAADLDAHAAHLHTRVDAWLAHQRATLDRRQTWHHQSLLAYMSNTGQTTVKLLSGTIKLLKGRERVEIEDPKRFVDTADPAFVRLKVSKEPNKVAILAHLHSTGEILDGVELVRGQDTVKVDAP